MARDYGRIRAQFWNDEKVKTWPIDLKAVAAYLMTCEHATALGAFRLPAAYMSDDLDVTPGQARTYLADLQSRGWLKVCPATGWVWIINYLRHNRPENVNVWKHIRGLAAGMPGNVVFKADVLATIERRVDDPKEQVSKEEIEPEKPSPNGIETVSNNNTDPILSEPIRSVPSLQVEGAQDAPPAPKGHRLPDDWQAGEAEIEFAVEQGFHPDQIGRIADKFRDHWHAVAGAKGRKADWLATWRNWVRTDAEKLANGKGQHGRGGVAPAGKSQRDIQLAAAVEAARRAGSGYTLWDADQPDGADPH